MRILVAEKDIIQQYVPLDKSEYRWKLAPCLPSDCDGYYHVSVNGSDFELVTKADIWKYPFIKINMYVEDEDYCDGDKLVSNQGFALMAFDIPCETPDDVELSLGVYPSFVSVFNGNIQVIFKLQEFMPKNATPRSFRFLSDMMNLAGVTLRASESNILINPLSDCVDSFIFNSDGIGLHDMKKISRMLKSEEHVTSIRKKVGRLGQKARLENSKFAIECAIRQILAEGRKVTKAEVVKLSARSKPTVIKHWDDIMAKIGRE